MRCWVYEKLRLPVICIMCLAQMRQSRTPSNHHVCLQRMGGYRRVAAALELEYLPPKRGRGASAPWSPDRADSELALVQFTQRGADTSTTYSSSSSRSIVAQPKPLVASRRLQLQQPLDLRSSAVAANSKSAAGRHRRRTDHDRIGRSTGKTLPLFNVPCFSDLSASWLLSFAD